MLYYLTDDLEDKDFGTLMESIRNSFWPKDEFLKQVKHLPVWSQKTPDADQRLKILRESLERITQDVSQEKLYTVYGRDASGRLVASSRGDIRQRLPFADRYHLYFLQRQWEYPYKKPRNEYKNLFRLEKPNSDGDQEPDDKASLFQNYSKHWGDYFHFQNVVMSTARFIEYFRNKDHVRDVLHRHDAESAKTEPEYIRDLPERLHFSSHSNLRTFRLVLAAYYHDLGKTVENHRHGMEGASILANHTTHATDLLKEIFQCYEKPEGKQYFERDDLLQITHLIYYHDQFGMLATGEAGYARLVDLLHRLRRSTITENIQKQRDWSCRYLFDLWVLNLADIMVSLDGRKFEYQREFLERTTAEARISAFLSTPKAHLLQHDLRIALKLMESQNVSQHADDLSPLEHEAVAYARRHVVERIRRLVLILTVDIRKEHEKEFGAASPAIQILDCVSNFSESQWNSSIARCIYSLGDYGEFIERFCWIGQMDYAFGFFHKIAHRALLLVNQELENQKQGRTTSHPTSWVYQPREERAVINHGIRTNAEFFADNLASTLVQILHHLLFREREIDRLRNLEFWVANQRLTDEKIDRIITLEGPFRTRSSVQLALESIFIW